MNILFIMNYAPAYSGNFMSSIWALEERINQDKGKCVFVYPEAASRMDWVKKMQHDGELVFFKNGRLFHDYKLFKSLVGDYNIDIVYLHFWSLNDAIAIKSVQKKYKSLKFGIHHHNEYHVSDSRFREAVKHKILDADFHIGCSAYVTNEVKDAGYRNVYNVDNCVVFTRLDNWETLDLDSLSLKSRGGVLLLTFTSYSFQAKGIDLSLKAIKRARDLGAKIDLLIVIANERELMLSQISAVCKEICGDIPDWVHIMNAREDVGTYYHAVDAYLNSSRTEGFCYASIEAIYCGAQVIQSNIPQNRLDIPGTLVFESENVEQLTARLMEFSMDSRHDSALQRDYVLERYSIDKWAGRILEVFDNETKKSNEGAGES